MKKFKCDFCGRRATAMGERWSIVGKPKHRMSSDEMAAARTRPGDNKPMERRICSRCRAQGRHLGR